MVALWLRHDNDDDQRHSERDTPRIKKTRSGKPAQSEQRDNFYFRNNARWSEPKRCSNSTISERNQKICKAKMNQAFENDWRRNFMKIIQFTVCFLLATFLCGFGCSSPKPTPDPLAGWQKAYGEEPNQIIEKDYQDYIHTLSPDEQKYARVSGYYKDGTGQHAVQIEIPLNGTWWFHVLIYDKDNKRIKTIKYSSGGYSSGGF